MLYAILILDTYLLNGFLCLLLPLVIVVSTKLGLPISPKLHHFHETCQVKENGKHLWPKCLHFGQKKRSMNLVCMSSVALGHLL